MHILYMVFCVIYSILWNICIWYSVEEYVYILIYVYSNICVFYIYTYKLYTVEYFVYPVKYIYVHIYNVQASTEDRRQKMPEHMWYAYIQRNTCTYIKSQ